MKICFWDFDGTLFHSQLPESGKAEWLAITGQPWPYQGWWGRLESLDSRLSHKPNFNVIEQYKQRPDAIHILLTNRLSKFKPIIQSFLDQQQIVLDKLTFKCSLNKSDRILEQLQQYPMCTEVEVWDDMEDQLQDLRSIQTILRNKGIKYTIHAC